MLTSTLVADISTNEILTGVIDLLSDWKGKRKKQWVCGENAGTEELHFLFISLLSQREFLCIFLFICSFHFSSFISCPEIMSINCKQSFGHRCNWFYYLTYSVAPAVTIYGKSVIKGKRNISNTLSDKGNELQRKKI